MNDRFVLPFDGPLDLPTTLSSGQCFRCRVDDAGAWTGLISADIVRLARTPEGVAIERARVLAGVEQATLVTYHTAGKQAKKRYSRFWTEAPTDVSAAAVQLATPLFGLGGAGLPAGFYYLWPEALLR